MSAVLTSKNEPLQVVDTIIINGEDYLVLVQDHGKIFNAIMPSAYFLRAAEDELQKRRPVQGAPPPKGLVVHIHPSKTVSVSIWYNGKSNRVNFEMSWIHEQALSKYRAFARQQQEQEEKKDDSPPPA